MYYFLYGTPSGDKQRRVTPSFADMSRGLSACTLASGVHEKHGAAYKSVSGTGRRGGMLGECRDQPERTCREEGLGSECDEAEGALSLAPWSHSVCLLF